MEQYAIVVEKPRLADREIYFVTSTYTKGDAERLLKRYRKAFPEDWFFILRPWKEEGKIGTTF